jgi:hypothetical protein
MAMDRYETGDTHRFLQVLQQRWISLYRRHDHDRLYGHLPAQLSTTPSTDDRESHTKRVASPLSGGGKRYLISKR